MFYYCIGFYRKGIQGYTPIHLFRRPISRPCLLTLPLHTHRLCPDGNASAAMCKPSTANTRNKIGVRELKAISELLRKELPGLRGFSETNLKNMRTFYEAWSGIESNSSVALSPTYGGSHLQGSRRDGSQFTQGASSKRRNRRIA